MTNIVSEQWDEDFLAAGSLQIFSHDEDSTIEEGKGRGTYIPIPIITWINTH